MYINVCIYIKGCLERGCSLPRGTLRQWGQPAFVRSAEIWHVESAGHLVFCNLSAQPNPHQPEDSGIGQSCWKVLKTQSCSREAQRQVQA